MSEGGVLGKEVIVRLVVGREVLLQRWTVKDVLIKEAVTPVCGLLRKVSYYIFDLNV